MIGLPTKTYFFCFFRKHLRLLKTSTAYLHFPRSPLNLSWWPTITTRCQLCSGNLEMLFFTPVPSTASTTCPGRCVKIWAKMKCRGTVFLKISQSNKTGFTMQIKMGYVGVNITHISHSQNGNQSSFGYTVHSHHPWAHWHCSPAGYGWHHCGETPKTGDTFGPPVSTHPSESHKWHGKIYSKRKILSVTIFYYLI